MGLIVELASTNNDLEYDRGDEFSDLSVDDRIANLKEYFYPKQQLYQVRSYLSLLKGVEDDDDRSNKLPVEYKWESDSNNWVNCPEAVVKFETLLNSLDLIDKPQLAALVPMSLQLLQHHCPEHRIKGIEFMERLFQLCRLNTRWLTDPNVHFVVAESLQTSITLNSYELVQRSIESCEFLVKVTTVDDSNRILDSMIERILSLLFYKAYPDLRIAYWRGAFIFIQLADKRFVRWFYQFFKACSYCCLEYTSEDEIVYMLKCFNYLSQILNERFGLRINEVNEMLLKISKPSVMLQEKINNWMSNEITNNK